jgi:coenzyme F420-reducing hydrogenase delta subunit/Pyruvate/2-oxoacid:ferredoxin oxidoreductase delta subunit
MSKLIATIDRWANKVLTTKYNPFYYLGQLSVFLLAVLVVTGIYILLFYKINVDQAYEAVEYITVDQWYLGGIMRSIHRYASDALIITLALHGMRLLLTGKFRFTRWIIWVSGIVLFGFILIEGITGYWMVWDERAQLVAVTTAEFFDSLPIFPKPLARAFISEESVTNLLFFAVIFVHVGGPMFLMALILLHFSRFTRTLLLPPRKIWGVVLLIMLATSLIKPAVSAPPADLSKVPTDVPVDWFYMFLLPLMHSEHGLYAWLFILLISAVFLALPWIKRNRPPTTAEIVEEKCVGCELCYVDCPYGAITMEKKDGKNIAIVSASRCAGCGTCLGSCNFNAVKLGENDLDGLKARISELLSGGDAGEVLVMVCERSSEISEITDDTGGVSGVAGTKVLPLPCIGMVNPSMITYALDSGAKGVFVCGCKIGDCHFRLGNKWFKGRMEGTRAPIIKDKRLDRIKLAWLSMAEKQEFMDELRAFRDRVTGRERAEEPAAREAEDEKERVRALYLPLAVLILLAPVLLIGYFSDSPSYSVMGKDESLLLFTMSHKGERLVPCVEPTIEELKARNFSECQRERVPVVVELEIDGEKMISKAYAPRGIRRDGPSYAYEKIRVEPGTHRVVVRIRDTREERFDHILDKEITFVEGRIVIIDFEEEIFTLK